ncbi:MAG TPA: twin-arginine translocase subunit TatC [Solirubrobacteraceae bacterium]|jgi:sec-independent protein translocase protein TatC|nr:twin-arginine translocase subunit TatC [Solirubrobacteraceae bacterium]
MPKLRPIGHEDRLSVVDHLDELRGRLILCGIVVVVAFGFCYWQNNLILNALNRPLPAPAKAQANHLGGLTGDTVKESRDLRGLGAALSAISRSTTSTLSAQDQALLTLAGHYADRAAQDLPQKTPKNLPITIGVGEGFTTTLTVCFYFALLVSLPVILFQAYAFVIPALSPHERRVALPIMLAAPLLFVIGVVFTYLVVLPPAVRFLQGYNSDQFQALVGAKPLYSFEVLTMGAIGLTFQMPLGLLGLRQLGMINGNTLTRHWRYATVIIAVIAAAMPGADPVTTALETAPLVILFLASIVMLKYADRREAKRAAEKLTTMNWNDDNRDDEA